MQVRFLITIIISLILIPHRIFAVAIIYSCSIASAPPLDFGTIITSDTMAETATTVVSVTCTNLVSVGSQGVTYTLTASPGNSGNQLSRSLKLLTNSLTYNMFTNNGYTTIFGDNTGGTGQFTMTYTLGALKSRTDYYTIYGRIPVQATPASGIYTDAITLTLTY